MAPAKASGTGKVSPRFPSRAPSTALLAARPVVPSASQIALAVAVVKSKPDDISIGDFILRLRQHLKHGKRLEADHTQHWHLDGASYWREQFERAESTRNEMQTRISFLERGKDELERRLTDAGLSEPATFSSKRKQETGGLSSTTNPVKCPKLSKDSTVRGEDPEASFGKDYETLNDVGKAGTTLVNNLYEVYKLYKQSSADAEAICFNLVQTARALGSVMLTICKRRTTAPSSALKREKEKLTIQSIALEKEECDLGGTIRASARAFSSLLVGLSKLSEDRQTRLAGIVIYECVKMFRTILDGITESALATARLNTEIAAAAVPSTAATKSRAKATKPVPDHTSRSIAQFLNAAVSSFKVGDDFHKQLFEGYLFILLERIGKRLFVCTFDRERSATIEGDISPPEKLGSASAGPRKELEQKALLLEIPTLVAMLEKAMAFAPRHMHANLATAAKSAKGGIGPRRPTMGSKVTLNKHAKERLQQTLINCMFGGDEKDDFLDCLRMPPRLSALPSLPKMEEKDTADWFKQEIWRLIGWEILGKGLEL